MSLDQITRLKDEHEAFCRTEWPDLNDEQFHLIMAGAGVGLSIVKAMLDSGLIQPGPNWKGD